MAEPIPSYKERIRRAREAGTYEHLREKLTDLVEVQRLSHSKIGPQIGLAQQTVRMACWTLGISVHNNDEHEGLVGIIRAYTASWDRGW